MKYLFLLIPLLAFSMDDFEKDLAALKGKYQKDYKKEEVLKWEEIVEKEQKPTFSEQFHDIFRQLDLSIFLNYYTFTTGFQPDGEIFGIITAAGPEVDMQIKAWNLFDIYAYGYYGITKPASFVELTQEYPVPNNYLLGLGAYFYNTPPKVSTYLAFEVQDQSYVGVNQNLDYSVVNVLSQLTASQVTSLNLTTGLDVPLKIFNNPGVFRGYLSPSIVAKSSLTNGGYAENVSQFQFGFNFKYFFYNNTLVDLSYKSGFYKGQSEQTFNLIYLNFGFRF
jgi:hypothetical protein